MKEREYELIYDKSIYEQIFTSIWSDIAKDCKGMAMEQLLETDYFYNSDEWTAWYYSRFYDCIQVLINIAHKSEIDTSHFNYICNRIDRYLKEMQSDVYLKNLKQNPNNVRYKKLVIDLLKDLKKHLIKQLKKEQNNAK